MSRLALLAAVLVAAPLAGCSGDMGSGSDVTFPAAPLAVMATEGGALHVEVRTAPDQPPSRGVVSVEYTITDEDGAPRDGLRIEVVPWMPDMGHGASVHPVVTAKGAGRYVVSDVELFMPGRWELRTSITGAAEDRATPAFQIP
jgi:predicted small secreted protein